jgi:hypothetical protein
LQAKAAAEDILIASGNPVRDPAAAQELPSVPDRVYLGRFDVVESDLARHDDGVCPPQEKETTPLTQIARSPCPKAKRRGIEVDPKPSRRTHDIPPFACRS